MDAPLRVGAYETDITPRLGTHLIGGYGPRVAVQVMDRLHAKAVVVDNGQTQVALVTVDLCMIEREEVDAAKARIQQRTGIPPENVLVSATHTHTGPAAVSILAVDKDPHYAGLLPDWIADAVENALRTARPAEMVFGQADVDQVFNRRWLLKDGRTVMNPGYLAPEAVRPQGPVDRRLTVAGFRCPETAAPLALYVNYPLHYVGTSPGNHVSADYFARVDSNLRQALGVPLAIISNGTTGDVNNCDFTKPAPVHRDPNGQAIKVAGIVAGAAMRAYYEGEVCEDTSLGGALFELQAVRDDVEATQLAEDEKTIANMDRMAPTVIEVPAFERLRLMKMPKAQPTWAHALRVGPAVYAGVPGEVFVEIGLEIQARSACPKTQCVSLANDWKAYIPTLKACAEGSYETEIGTARRLVPETAPALVEAALNCIRRVW